MADRIVVEGLRIDAVVGVYAHERRIHQRLIVDLAVATDIRAAAAADDITRAVDYDRLCELAREVALARPYWLIETMAEAMATRLLTELAGRISEVAVTVRKPSARTDVRDVRVEIVRRPGE